MLPSACPVGFISHCMYKLAAWKFSSFFVCNNESTSSCISDSMDDELPGQAMSRYKNQNAVKICIQADPNIASTMGKKGLISRTNDMFDTTRNI